MSDQAALFRQLPGVPTLTDRQAFALAELERVPDGLPADEVGARLHERRGKHDAGVRCEWCPTDGRAVLVELRHKGLVVRRRSGLWQLLRRATGPADFGEFPEGF